MKKLTMLVAAAFAMTSAMAQLNPMEPIPADKDVRTGKLENGMTYYIRHNEKPKGQADFHILHDRASPTSSSTWPSTARKTSPASR